MYKWGVVLMAVLAMLRSVTLTVSGTVGGLFNRFWTTTTFPLNSPPPTDVGNRYPVGHAMLYDMDSPGSRVIPDILKSYVAAMVPRHSFMVVKLHAL